MRLITQKTTIMPASCQSSQTDSLIPGGFTVAPILSRTGRSRSRTVHRPQPCARRQLERCPVLDPPSSPRAGSSFRRVRLAIIRSAGISRHRVWAGDEAEARTIAKIEAALGEPPTTTTA